LGVGVGGVELLIREFSLKRNEFVDVVGSSDYFKREAVKLSRFQWDTLAARSGALTRPAQRWCLLPTRVS
jgi:hypothetical protein